MIGLLIRLAWGHARRHRVEVSLSIIGVLLGVSVAVGIDGAVTASVASFRSAVASISGEASHRIERPGAQVRDEEYIDLLHARPGVPLAPVIDRRMLAPLEGGEPLLVRLLGVDPFADTAMRSFTAVRSDLDEAGFRRFMTEPGAVVVSEPLARALGVTRGDAFEIDAGAKRVQVTVVATLDVSGPMRDQLADLVLADLSTAQELADSPGMLDRIDVTLTSDADAAELRAKLAGLAGDAGSPLTLRSVSDRARELDELIAAYRLNLDALSLMASFVALFIVYNAMLVSVEQRVETLGILRCVGSSRTQLGGLYLLEALATALAGGVLGVVAGWGMAFVLVETVGGTISDLYAPIRPPAVALTAGMAGRGMAVALLSGLLGAAIPLWRAAHAPPITAMRQSVGRRGSQRAAVILLAIGLGLLAVALVTAVTPSRSVGLGFVVAALAALGFALCCPAMTAALAIGAGAIARRLQRISIHMAGAGVAHALRITGIAVAAMMLAMAMNIALLTMVQSFRTAVLDWLDQRFQADVYIGPRLMVDHRIDASLAPEVIDWVADRPETADWVTYRRADGQARKAPGGEPDRPFQPIHFVGAGVDRLLAADSIPLRTGPAAGVTFDPMRHALVSEPMTGRLELGVGDMFEVQAPTGTARFEVFAVFYDFGADRGVAMVTPEAFAQAWGDDSVNAVHVTLQPDVDVAATVAAWERELQARHPVLVHSHAYIKSETQRIFDRTFRVTDIMGWMAGGVAFCGLAGALLALSMARRREYAVLGAMGLSGRQTAAWVLAEGLLIAWVASIVACVAGVALAYVLAFIIQYRSFGWSIPMQVQPHLWLQLTLLASVAAVLASIYPIVRLRRASIAQVLREE